MVKLSTLKPILTLCIVLSLDRMGLKVCKFESWRYFQSTSFMKVNYTTRSAWLAQSVERLTLKEDIKRLRVRPPYRASFFSFVFSLKLVYYSPISRSMNVFVINETTTFPHLLYMSLVLAFSVLPSIYFQLISSPILLTT